MDKTHIESLCFSPTNLIFMESSKTPGSLASEPFAGWGKAGFEHVHCLKSPGGHAVFAVDNRGSLSTALTSGCFLSASGSVLPNKDLQGSHQIQNIGAARPLTPDWEAG